MAFRMGLDYSELHKIHERDHKEVLKIIPSRQMVNEEEWNAIQKYYLENAPDSLLTQTEKKNPPLTQFDASTFTLPIESNMVLTLVEFDSVNRKLFIGNRRGKLYTLNTSLQLEDSFLLESPPSDMVF